MKREHIIAIVALFLLAVVQSIYIAHHIKGGKVTADTLTVEKIDTQYITITDSFPVLKYKTRIKYIGIPVPQEQEKGDSVELEVVQKTFSDDSTYTAYVTGISYDDMPKLDSITVRQREITKMMERIITVKERKRWSFGIQVGAGLGITTLKPDIYVGVGGTYSF